MVGPLPADCPGSRLPTVAACEVALAWAAPLASVGRAGADKNGEKNGTGMGRGGHCWNLRGPGVALDLG